MRKVLKAVAVVFAFMLVAGRPAKAEASAPVELYAGFDPGTMTVTFSYTGECYYPEILYLYDNAKYPNWGTSAGKRWTAGEEVNDFIGDRVTESGALSYYVICWGSSEAITEFRGLMHGYSYAYAKDAESILSRMQSEGKLVYSSGDYCYEKPEAALKAPTNLHWSIDKDHNLMLGFDPVEDARGYIIIEKDYRSDSDLPFVHNNLDLSPGTTEHYRVEFDSTIDRKEVKVVAVSRDATVTAYSKPSTALTVSQDEYNSWVLNNETPTPEYKNGLVHEKDDTWSLYLENKFSYDYNDLYNDKEQGWWLVNGGKVNPDYTDLYCSQAYGWWKLKNGSVDFGYSDLYCSPLNGWWKINGGTVDFGYSDLYCSQAYGWWKINGGTVDFGYSDLYGSPAYGWWKIDGGTVDFTYSGLYDSPQYGMWVIKDGSVDFSANGEYESDAYGKWIVKDGRAVRKKDENAGEDDPDPEIPDPKTDDGLVMSADGTLKLYHDGTFTSDFNDLYCDATYGWRKVKDGIVDSDFNDLYCSPAYGWWKIKDGEVDFAFNDLYCSPTYGWWKISGGTVDFSYNDLYCSPSYGWWLVTGGAVDFDFTDLYCSPSCGWWLVTGGMVNFGYNDLFYSPAYGWWLVEGGTVAFGYDDIFYSDTYGGWKVTGGYVDFGCNGTLNGKTIVGGKVQ